MNSLVKDYAQQDGLWIDDARFVLNEEAQQSVDVRRCVILTHRFCVTSFDDVRPLFECSVGRSC